MDFLTIAGEQGYMKNRFQILDLLGQTRLRDVKFLGGT